MPASSLLALIDDIATLLDDVSLMTKVAAQKTAGVLGDDLALNAKQVSGIRAEREIPVVLAVAKGSFKNKLILVPLALSISALIPWAVIPLLMFGGVFLCFEGVEKLAHKYLHTDSEENEEIKNLVEAAASSEADLLAFEKDKIKGAVRTDFVLSAEIITITLGTVATATLTEQLAVLAGISVIMTVGVYGLVAGIVKLDDLGLHLASRSGTSFLTRIKHRVGKLLLLAAPWLMKALAIVGTAAMFLVGGGILTHGVPVAHNFIHDISHQFSACPYIGGFLEWISPAIMNLIVGVIAGALALACVSVVAKIGKLIRK